MDADIRQEQFFHALVTGDRALVRRLVAEPLADDGWSRRRMLEDLLWPVLAWADRLHRADQISDLAMGYAAEGIRRAMELVEAAARPGTPVPDAAGVVQIVAGAGAGAGAAAAILAASVEDAGWNVRLAAGRIPADEILADLADVQPVALVLFAAETGDAPQLRGLFDTMRRLEAAPGLPIVVGGGIFARVEDLAEVMGVDLRFDGPVDLVDFLRAAAAGPGAGRDRRTIRRTASSSVHPPRVA